MMGAPGKAVPTTFETKSTITPALAGCMDPSLAIEPCWKQLYQQSFTGTVVYLYQDEADPSQLLLYLQSIDIAISKEFTVEKAMLPDIKLETIRDMIAALSKHVIKLTMTEKETVKFRLKEYEHGLQ